jgi:hypothetical protein
VNALAARSPHSLGAPSSKKGRRKKRAEPKTRIGSVSCPVASAPDPNVRLKFEKPALDLSAIRQFGTLTYRRSERIAGTVAAPRAQSNGPDGEDL